MIKASVNRAAVQCSSKYGDSMYYNEAKCSLTIKIRKISKLITDVSKEGSGLIFMQGFEEYNKTCGRGAELMRTPG